MDSQQFDREWLCELAGGGEQNFCRGRKREKRLAKGTMLEGRTGFNRGLEESFRNARMDSIP
jgi:hypothetical protein